MTKEAFAEQVLAMTDSLYYISYSMLTNRPDQEDAVQEALRKGLQKCGSLREERYLKTWVTRILINECHNILRRRGREVPAEAVYAVAPETADAGVFETLSQLEEALRLPLVLHYYEGYTTREIAKLLRVPEGTVKGRLVRARKALGALLTEEEAMA